MLKRKRGLKNCLLLLLCAMLALSSTVLTAFAASTENDVSYLSSEYFVNDTTTAAWDDGRWVPQTYNPETDTYTEMAIKTSSGNRGEDGTGNYAAYSGAHKDNSPKVSAWWMNPASTLGSSGSLTDFTYSAVKTFVVPREGDIIVSFGKQFLSKTAANDARIVLSSNGKNEQVWPESGYYPVAIDNKEIPEAISLTVEKGDRIRFEIKRPAGKETGDHWSKTYWDPMITYLRDVYKSSESFVSSNTQGKWDNGIWAAQKFDGTTYSALTNTKSKASRDETASNAADVYYGLNIDHSPNVNQWWLAPGINDSTKTTADITYAAVKTFIAPKTGFVSVNFDKGIYTYNSAAPLTVTTVNANGERTVLWTDTITKGTTYLKNEAIKLTVNKGDKINFEVSIPAGTTSTFYTKVYCDPTVSYVAPYTESEVTVTQTGVDVNAEILGLTKSSIIIVAGYDAEGNIEDFKTFSAKALESPVALTGDVKNVKIMVWNSFDELVPVTDVETITDADFIK